MNDSIAQQLTRLQYSHDASQCFEALCTLLTEQADEHLGQSDTLPFDAFWQTCCRWLAPRQITISKVDFNGASGGGEQDEYIELVNNGPMSLDLGGWRINAGDRGQDMTFPEKTLIEPYARLAIYTRKKGEFSFNSPVSIWNNKGDTALLYDAKGNLVCSYAYGEEAHEDIELCHIHFDGEEKRSEGDEYAVIRNNGDHWLDIGGWTLSAGAGQDFRFDSGALLKPQGEIRVYTNREDDSTGGYSFHSATAVWNNKGDTGTLSDYQDTQVSKLSYGDAA